ncbi:rRNA maturation RNase YbeY [Candidatus Gracilibacteria bacterium]|nr:rRNA maturation RNase YbeY [Candidatus Gracilibacteria bacterium]
MFSFKYFHIPRTLSRSYCTRVLQALEETVKKPQEGIVHLIVISSEEMARMNEQFRGKTGPTDILTFSYLQKMNNDEGIMKNGGFFGTKNMVAGEIYLCLEKIKTYAEESGKTYKEQLEYIIIHGMVHLMGYDHESEEDWREMEKVEKKIQSLLK